MNSGSLRRLIRHFYRDGTYSFHYAPVEPNTDDALVDTDNAVTTSDPADRFTYWPPQPMTLWLNESRN